MEIVSGIHYRYDYGMRVYESRILHNWRTVWAPNDMEELCIQYVVVG